MSRIRCCFSAFALVVVSFTGYFIPVQAQVISVVSTVKFIPPPPPDQDAPSGRRRGGASRCPECKNDLRLTALVPGDRSKSVLSLTVAEHPTFWFYIPYALTSEHNIEFVLQDAADNYIYKTSFTAPKTPIGIVSITLPAKTPALEIGKQYHWTFLIYYDAQKASKYVAVDGLVQRVAPSLQLMNQIKQATPQELTQLYAANGIWHETLTTLAELHRTYPQDAQLTADWVNLLQSVGLDDIATEPIVQCC